MGSYEVLPGGELRRYSMSYAEELRPLKEERARPMKLPAWEGGGEAKAGRALLP
jgi:hypothetical protein